MKKILLVSICISFLFCLTGCGNKTKLTTENYEKYLDVTVSPICDRAVIGKMVFYECAFQVFIDGKSQNFNYHDVEVVVKITGSDGENNEYNNFEIKINSGVSDITGKTEPVKKTIEETFGSDGIKYDFEIVSVKGYVTPA